MTILHEEIYNIIYDHTGVDLFCQGCQNNVDEILKLIKSRIDIMIQIDDQTLNMKHVTKEGKIAAQASKNTLTLVKEMLNH